MSTTNTMDDALRANRRLKAITSHLAVAAGSDSQLRPDPTAGEFVLGTWRRDLYKHANRHTHAHTRVRAHRVINRWTERLANAAWKMRMRI